MGLRILFLMSALLLPVAGDAPAVAEPPVVADEGKQPVFEIDGSVGLASLIALSEARLRTLVTAFEVIAATPEGRSAAWEEIRAPLTETAKAEVPALIWFARPDGRYWSVQNGAEEGDLSTRDYWPRVMKGETVIGDLVVSKATGKSSAIIAVPIRRDERTVGVLGASVFLDRFSARLEKDMSLDEGTIFYSFDEEPTLALVWDPDLILANPRELSPEVGEAFEQMLQGDEGVVKYEFRDTERTVLFRKSSYTGWRYAFGLTPEGRERTEKRAR